MIVNRCTFRETEGKGKGYDVGGKVEKMDKEDNNKEGCTLTRQSKSRRRTILHLPIFKRCPFIFVLYFLFFYFQSCVSDKGVSHRKDRVATPLMYIDFSAFQPSPPTQQSARLARLIKRTISFESLFLLLCIRQLLLARRPQEFVLQ